MTALEERPAAAPEQRVPLVEMRNINVAFGGVHAVRDVTIDNEVYVAQPNLAGGFAPGAPAFAGPINTVATTGKRLVFDNVLLKGGQDTLYTITGIAYFHRRYSTAADLGYGPVAVHGLDCDGSTLDRNVSVVALDEILAQNLLAAG